MVQSVHTILGIGFIKSRLDLGLLQLIYVSSSAVCFKANESQTVIHFHHLCQNPLRTSSVYTTELLYSCSTTIFYSSAVQPSWHHIHRRHYSRNADHTSKLRT